MKVEIQRFINRQQVEIDQIIIPVDDIIMTEAYCQRWQQDIYSRFRETKKRFPEFFPCFELKYDLAARLQYSIHFQPLTGHATALIQSRSDFPHQEKFKPIEQLWDASGQSELDELFERFPTQLALNPPKPSLIKLCQEWLKKTFSTLKFRKVKVLNESDV